MRGYPACASSGALTYDDHGGSGMKRFLIIVAAAALLSALPAGAEGPVIAKPSPKDKCPVCGMFVSKYPDWVATLMFKDGTLRYFDGPKDLFKFLLDLKQYAPGKGQSDVDRFFVNDYYAVRQIDGRAAFYVLGSDVYGPMGKELIPFEKETEALEFLKDHGARRVLRINEITPAVLKELD
jgi:nitrous oxide reductase accessory protein NosL